MPRTTRTIAVLVALPLGALTAPVAAHAASDDATQHFVVQQTDYYPKAGDDPSLFAGIFSLDGVCGFAHARYSYSDTETFFIAQHNNAMTGYKYNAVGRIDNESWKLTPVTADGTDLPTFTGTADEIATATGVDNGATPLSVNYTFNGVATNPAGQRLQLVIKGVLRTDADHNVTRFDWGVQSCQVH